MDQELKAYLEGMEERIKQLISDTASRADERFDTVERRIDSLASRLDRVETNLGAVALQTTGFNKSLADHDRLIQGILATQSAEQRAFDALAKQLREHRHENGGAPKQ